MGSYAEEFPEQAFAAASDKILDAVQNALAEKLIPGGGRVASFVTIVETFDEDGNARVFPFWSDNRTSILLGLLAYGQVIVQSGMGGAPRSD